MPRSPSHAANARLAELASAFRTMRKRKGLTQAALAELTGRTQARISALESARDDAQATTLLSLARALGCELLLIPKEHAAEVKRLVDLPTTAKAPATLFDEVFVPDPED